MDEMDEMDEMDITGSVIDAIFGNNEMGEDIDMEQDEEVMYEIEFDEQEEMDEEINRQLDEKYLKVHQEIIEFNRITIPFRV